MPLQIMHNDVLLGILRHASWTKDRKENFKQQLYLLAIFQRLRAIALPKIYNHVFITNNGYKKRERQRYANKYSKPFAEFIYTNADVIALANCTHMVKSLRIYQYNLSRTFAELYNCIEALKLCSNSWTNITKLSFSMDYDSSSGNPDSTILIERCQMSNKYSQKLANIIPGVANLTLLNGYNSRDTNEFYSLVVGAYANQLVKYINIIGIDNTGRYRFEAMQFLHLSISTREVLPRVNSRTLVDLHIDNMPFDTSWAPFLDSKGDTVVEFSCLKSLYLKFFSFATFVKTDLSNLELLLKFPGLNSLTIICKSSICPFFKMAKFPDEMDDISIKAPPALLAQLKDAWMPTAKRITMCS